MKLNLGTKRLVLARDMRSKSWLNIDGRDGNIYSTESAKSNKPYKIKDRGTSKNLSWAEIEHLLHFGLPKLI